VLLFEELPDSDPPAETEVAGEAADVEEEKLFPLKSALFL
jgi:hypothetical protein